MRKGEKDSLFNKICYHLQEIIKIKHLVMRLTICIWIIFLLFISPNAFSFSSKEWNLEIKGAISETYDDNTTFVKEDKKDDFITRLSLGLEGKYGGRTRVLGFKSRIAQSIFANEHNNNNLSGDFNLNFLNELSKYHRIILSDTFKRTLVPGTFEDEFGRIRGRYRSYHNKFNLIYSRDISKKLTVTTNYSNALDDISEKDTNNSYQNSAGLSASYIHSAATNFSLTYNVSKRRYEDARDTSTHTFSAGMRRYITKRLYFDGRIGVNFMRTVEDNNVTGEDINVSLTDEIDRNTVASLSFTKRIREAPYREERFDFWQTSVAFTRQLLKRLGCSFAGFYGKGTLSPSDTTERLLGANVAVAYSFSEDLKGNLNYTFSDKDSTDKNAEYIRNVVSLGLTVKF